MYKLLKKFYYKLLSLFTSGKGVKTQINGYDIRLPAYYYRLFPANYEEDNFRFMKERLKPGMVCIDIGAHIGVYAVQMARNLGGRVYSFEPTPDSVKVLKETVRINGCTDSVTIVQAAVAEKKGKSVFYINEKSTYIGDNAIYVGNSLIDVPLVDKDSGEKIERKGYDVDLISVDEFVQTHQLQIGFIKIDAEGAELGVLKGAAAVFTSAKPSGILGLHPFAYADSRQELGAIFDLMTSTYGYTLYDNGKTVSRDLFTERKDIFDVQFLFTNQ